MADEQKTVSTRQQNPFGVDPIYNDADLDKYTADKLKQLLGGVDDAVNAGKSGTDAEYNKVKQTPNTDIYQHANANNARGEGQFGMFNNRDYNTTLKLAREADAYNNMPQEKRMTFQSGGSGQMGTLSYTDKFERPKVQTMETRAMDQSIELDTNQKNLAQDLQSAVARKDLDAFIAAWKQRYGFELDREQAAIEMNKWTRQQEMLNVVRKNFDKWSSKWQRWFNVDTLGAIQDLVAENDIFALYIGSFLTGGVSPTLDDLQGQEAIRNVLKKEFPTWDGKYINSNIPNIQIEYQNAKRSLQLLSASETAKFAPQVKKLGG